MDGIPSRRLLYPVVALATVLGLVLSAFAAWGLHTWEHQRAQAVLSRVTTGITASVKGCLEHQSVNVRLIATLHEAFAEDIGRREFARFASPMVAQCDEIVALGWIPRVPSSERGDFEARVGQQQAGFVIGERDPGGRFVPASGRAEYFPIVYMEPEMALWSVLGFDVASNPTHRAALNEARDTGGIAFAEHPEYSGGDPEATVYEIMFYPVHDGEIAPDPQRVRRAPVRGFVTGVSRLSGIVEEALAKAGDPAIGVTVLKRTTERNWKPVYRHPAPGNGSDDIAVTEGAPHFETAVEIGGDIWKLSFLPAPGAYPDRPGWMSFGVFAGGLALTMLSAAYLQNSRRHTERVEGEVVERRLAEERFRTALKASPVGVFNQNRELRYTWAQNLDALHDGELVGKTDADVITDAPALERLTALKQQVLETGDGAREQIEVSMAGRRRFFDVTLEPLVEPGREPTGITGAVFDMTEHLRLTRRLQAQTQQLAEADRRKDEFLALLAHELRNPLAPVSNVVQLIKRQGTPAPETVRWAMGMIERQVQHLTRLVDDLLDVARITRGRITLVREPVRLADLLSVALETEQPLFDQNQHTLAVALPTQPLVVEGDKVRLVQVFANLLDNAAKYTPRGGRIEVSAQREGREAVVRVRDTGIGIPREALPRLFDMFVQIDHPAGLGGSSGLGLGLSLSRRLVEMHGGRIEAMSPGPGRGSEFSVHLPLFAEESGSSADLQEDESFANEAHRVRALVVEDQVEVAASFSMLLEAMGHTVRTVHDGAAAIAVARRFRPDVAFVDIRMPGMDGYEVARRLRKEFGKRLALVAVTGFGQERDRQRAFEAGFDQHLLKPVRVESLEDLLHSLALARGGIA